MHRLATRIALTLIALLPLMPVALAGGVPTHADLYRSKS